MTLRKLAAASCVLVLLGATDFVHRGIPSTAKVELGEAYVPKPEFAQLAALGFDAVLADYYWIQAVHIVGAAFSPAKHADQLGQMIDVVTTLDPWVGHPYRFAAVWLTGTEEQVRLGNKLLRRGVEHHPDDWRNYFYLGFNHFFYLLESEIAAEVLAQAIQREGAPPYLSRLVARLRHEGSGDLDSAEVFVRQLAEDAGSPAEKAIHLSALDEIEVERKARFLDRARKAYRELNGFDVDQVVELTALPNPVIEKLPSPYPDDLPMSLRGDAKWIVDRDRDEIVSTYYGKRYRLNLWAEDRERAERWRRERKARGSSAGIESENDGGESDV